MTSWSNLVWSGKFVSPETVTQRIKLVRQALGDNANSPRYIGLVRGEGYRMLAEVQELSEQDDGIAQHLFAELGRRRVLQTALIYAAAAWSITEVLSFLIEALPVFPEGSKSFVAILFVVGFPVTMFLAWRFDIGPGGIRRTQAASAEGRLTIVAATSPAHRLLRRACSTLSIRASLDWRKQRQPSLRFERPQPQTRLPLCHLRTRANTSLTTTYPRG